MASKRPASAGQRRHSWHPAAAEHVNKATPVLSQHEQKRRSREEMECAQFLRMQHKLVAKPTETYAKIRLVVRQDEAARKRSLHRNGSGNINRVGSNVSLPVQQTSPPAGRVRPRTARDPPVRHHAEGNTGQRVRPQSARPRHSERDTTVSGQQISVALLERAQYNPIPLTTHLAASRSAPRLQAALKYSTATRRTTPATVATGRASSSVSQPTLFTEENENDQGRRHIVVHMQRVVITGDDDDDVEPTIEMTTGRASGTTRRSPRVDSSDHLSSSFHRNAWQD